MNNSRGQSGYSHSLLASRFLLGFSHHTFWYAWDSTPKPPSDRADDDDILAADGNVENVLYTHNRIAIIDPRSKKELAFFLFFYLFSLSLLGCWHACAHNARRVQSQQSLVLLDVSKQQIYFLFSLFVPIWRTLYYPLGAWIKATTTFLPFIFCCWKITNSRAREKRRRRRNKKASNKKRISWWLTHEWKGKINPTKRERSTKIGCKKEANTKGWRSRERETRRRWRNLFDILSDGYVLTGWHRLGALVLENIDSTDDLHHPGHFQLKAEWFFYLFSLLEKVARQLDVVSLCSQRDDEMPNRKENKTQGRRVK